MSEPVAFRRGHVSLVQGDAGAWTIYDGQGGGLKLDAESFRWLVQTSGPAALCIPVEEDAGAGGGPAPAAADGTEAAGSREEAEALTLDVGDAGAIDRYGVRWEGDGSFTPTCPACAWSGKPRGTHSEAESAVRSHRKTKRHEGNAAAV